MKKDILLGVNIDHVATIRQARGTYYPDPVFAAQLAEQAGADGITVHLREDRRHIQERDLFVLKETLLTRMNLEVAISESMIPIVEKVKPVYCCFVPEKREELTTEGGLDVLKYEDKITDLCVRLKEQDITVSLFIEANHQQIEAAKRTGAPIIEIHTGKYAEERHFQKQMHELAVIQKAAAFAANIGLEVNAGHGLHYQNVQAIAKIPEFVELNIGHAIIARAVMSGMVEAVSTMKQLMLTARSFI